MDTLLRHWVMLKLIPHAPKKITTVQLKDRLETHDHFTTLRTIQRDLDKLSSIFQITSDNCKPAGWNWPKDAPRFDIPGMESEAALVFRMAQLHLSRLLPESSSDFLQSYYKQAQDTLEKINPNGIAAWHEKVAVSSRSQALLPPQEDPEVVRHIYEALLHSRQLKVGYHRRGEAQTKEATLHPLGIVMVDNIHYLVCTFWNYQDLRHLPLHRIDSAEVLEEPATVPVGFKLQDYVASGVFGFPESDGPIRLKALFKDGIAVHLEETPLSKDQVMTAQGDGRIQIEATVQDTAQLRWWLMGFGDGVEVLEPESLREEFTVMAERLAASYL